MDNKYLKLLLCLFIGVFLIVIEFVMYNYFDVLAKNQILIMLVTFYLARTAYKDIDHENIIFNQILAITLGMIYGIFTSTNPAMYALFFYAVTTFMTKYARNDNLYMTYVYVTAMYFIFFVIRVLYMTYMHGVAFDFLDIIVKNILLVTIINGSICFGISIYRATNESKLRERKKHN